MITILRIGHRLDRDNRVSTHCGLVSRALGADSIVYSGERDDKMMDSVRDVSSRFGGKFPVSYEESFRKAIKTYKKKKFCIVHLTMYGLLIQKKIGKIRKSKNILVIVGSEKVPGEVYGMADYNIAVTNQPHSEIAALSIFLNQCIGKKSLEKKFSKAKITVLPCERGKKVIEKK